MASRALLDLLVPGAVVETLPPRGYGKTRDKAAAGALEELRQDLVRLRRVAAGR